MSTKNAWYLDHGFWGATTYYPWRTVYRNRLPNHPGVLGGEVNRIVKHDSIKVLSFRNSTDMHVGRTS